MTAFVPLFLRVYNYYTIEIFYILFQKSMAQSSSVNHCYGVASLCFVLALQLFNILAHEVTNGHANHDYINHRLKELICTQGQRHI